MIDWSRIDVLREEIGAEGFAEVVTLFLDESDEVVTRIAAAAPGGSLATDLHFLRGSALNLGFETLAQLCDAAERALAGNRGPDADLARIVSVYTESRAMFLASLEDNTTRRSAG